MAGLEIKNIDSPDETRTFADKGEGGVYDVGGHAVLYSNFQPGWRWSEHVKPKVGTEKCEAPHLLYGISGRMRVQHNDGSEGEIGPGDLAAIAPGHDAWVVGDEPFVSVDFGGYRRYGQPAE
jgi:quercetin dioxygenase-like cupin family protein